ncbi:MAG: Glu/Leu/Phe/Val dehydrogenase, partial [Gammaproteobacteria bacterium]|nr:Glu/Leu/Phe/Val dehydrogenase [Gammaproteobacteria bacterium]
GAVGKHASRFLAAEGAVIVAAADSRGMVNCPNGLDVKQLAEIKAQGGSVVDYQAGAGVTTGDREAIIDVPCDIWIPAARPDVIRADNLDRLQAGMVVSGANIAVTAEAEQQLHDRGILCIPDFIANAGGVICAAMEYQGAGEAMAMQAIEEKLCHNVQTILELSKRQACLPREAAVDMAMQRVQKAMQLRRWSLF